VAVKAIAVQSLGRAARTGAFGGDEADHAADTIGSDQGVIAVAAGELIAVGAAIDHVVAAAARDSVGASLAQQHVVAAQGVDGIGKVGADDRVPAASRE